MSLKKISIDPSGGDVILNLTFTGDNAVISYKWNLWETTTNSKVYPNDKVGTNLNPNDDSYKLPSPASLNVGRLLIIDYGVVEAEPDQETSNWSICAQIEQDGTSESQCDEGKLTASYTSGSIYIHLTS